MSRRVRIHHFVVAEIVKPQTQSWRATDLFGASHWLDVPADTEFPHTIARVHLFARFYLRRAKPAEFQVRIKWLDTPNRRPRVIGNFGPLTVPFVQDTTARDWSFNLHNIRVQGVGVHRVELIRERAGGWKPGKPVRVATTYFVVER